jgi:hypothetical protein
VEGVGGVVVEKEVFGRPDFKLKVGRNSLGNYSCQIQYEKLHKTSKAWASQM